MNKIDLAKASYKLTLISATMIFLGILLGGFIKYTVLLASCGTFLLIVSIIMYIISELK